MTQEERSPKSDRYMGARVELLMATDNSVRELIAFNDLSEFAVDNQRKMQERWMKSYIPLMGVAARKDFAKAARAVAEATIKAADHAEKSPGDTSPSWTVKIPGGDAGAAVNATMISAMLSLANYEKITGRAFLIAAESSFEVLFGQLARVIYEKHPDALPKSDHAFTLDELSSFDTIDDARDAIMMRKIESLLRESPDEWSKWLKRTVGMSMDQVTQEWLQAREIFIRRNILVHTDSTVTPRYLVEVKRAGGGATGLKVGDSLIPTRAYLKSALQQLIALEVLLVYKVISHIDKLYADQAAGWLSGRLEWMVRKELWDAACLIADSFQGTNCKRSTLLRVQVDGWLAHKKRDGLDSVRNDVETWDVTGLSKKYEIYKKVLLDQFEEKHVAGLITEGTLTRFDILTHPMYSSLRHWLPPVVEELSPADEEGSLPSTDA